MAERLLSEQLSIIATIDPQSSSTTLKSDVWDMENFEKVMAIVAVGAFGTSGTLNAKFEASATSNGTFTTVAGKKITALTEAGSDGNKQAIINLSAPEVAASTHRWARVFVTSAQANLYSVIVLGQPRRTEAFTTIAAKDLSSVDEIVT